MNTCTPATEIYKATFILLLNKVYVIEYLFDTVVGFLDF